MKSTVMASPRLLPMAFVFVRSLLTLMVLSGCASIGMPAAAESVLRADPPQIRQMAQVIVKFRDPAFDPTQQGYLKGRARYGCRNIRLRPAHVGRRACVTGRGRRGYPKLENAALTRV